MEDGKKSNLQQKREWEEYIKQQKDEREQDVRLRCLEMLFKHGPEPYLKGDVPFQVADRMFSYTMYHTPNTEFSWNAKKKKK